MDPAQSGISLNRPALKALLAECRAGNIGTVIIRSLDRIARDNTLIEKVLRKFNENGVRVEFSTEHGKADFRFMRAAAGALAEFEKTRV
jgi:DNA invertase Pin-like site-specific DNA recombinase